MKLKCLKVEKGRKTWKCSEKLRKSFFFSTACFLFIPDTEKQFVDFYKMPL